MRKKKNYVISRTNNDKLHMYLLKVYCCKTAFKAGQTPCRPKIDDIVY